MHDRAHSIKAVLFDLGDTILNFGQVRPLEVFRLGSRLSYDFLKGLSQPVGNFKWYCWRNLTSLRFHHFISNILKNDFSALDLLKKLGARAGYELSEQQWKHLEWLWYEPLSKYARIEPDIKQTLTRLKDMQLKLGILSNTFVSKNSLEKHLEQFGILKFFDVRVYSYEFTFRKPDARIFKITAQRIEEGPENILFTGDRIDNDVSPAIKTGMYGVFKDNFACNSSRLPKKAFRVKLLSELPELIEKINSQAHFAT